MSSLHTPTEQQYVHEERAKLPGPPLLQSAGQQPAADGDVATVDQAGQQQQQHRPQPQLQGQPLQQQVSCSVSLIRGFRIHPVAGVLDEPYSQLKPA